MKLDIKTFESNIIEFCKIYDQSISLFINNSAKELFEIIVSFSCGISDVFDADRKIPVNTLILNKKGFKKIDSLVDKLDYCDDACNISIDTMLNGYEFFKEKNISNDFTILAYVFKVEEEIDYNFILNKIKEIAKAFNDGYLEVIKNQKNLLKRKKKRE